MRLIRARRYGVLILAVVFALACGLAATAHAQSAGTGTIQGTIQDESRAVVPDAAITVRNVSKNVVSRKLTSNPEGRYVAPFLEPGEYEIIVEKTGFGKLVRTGVLLGVGETTTVDLTLKVATTAETVTVTGEAPLVEPEKTESSQTVSKVLVENLPINGRRWEDFVLLTPGVSTDGGFGLVSYRGISGIYNNNTVDGADNNQAMFSESRGRTRIAYAYSQETIKEFQVSNSNFSAEFGRAAGGIVNALTKSGTNEWHGGVFYYLRHFHMNALDPVSKSRGATEKPEKIRHQFGGSVGGPIYKDKFFFFGSYDGQRRSFPVRVITSDAKFFTSIATPSNCPSQATAAQCSSAIAFLQSLQGTFPRQGDQDVYFGKLDYQVSQNNRISASLNWHDWRAQNGFLTGVTLTDSVLASGNDKVKSRFVVVNWNSAIGNRMANEFRFQYGKDFEAATPNFPGPFVSISGGPAYGLRNSLPRPAFPDERRWQWTDNFSISGGRHSFKLGFDINAIHEVLDNLFQGGGIYSYVNTSNPTRIAFQNWVIDVFGIDVGDGRTGRHYTTFTQTSDPITGTGKDDFWNLDYAFYVQDNWKVRSNLLLSFGFRSDLQTVPQPERPNTATPLLTKFTSRINIDRNNLAPRVGIAWQPFKKTVVRTGYGLYYAKTTNSTFYTVRVENGVFQQTFTCRSNVGSTTPPQSCAPLFPNLIFTPPGPTPVAPFAGALTPQVVDTKPPATAQLARGLSPDFVNPLVHMGELVIEQELPGKISVSTSYLFSRGQRLPVFIDTNLAPPTLKKTYDITDSTGATVEQVTVPLYSARIDTATGVILTGFSSLNSWYHAFVLTVRKPYSHGLELLANLTISKAIDNGQVIGDNGTFNGTDPPLDPLNQAQEKALSDLDQRRRFVVSAVWEPFYKPISNAFLRRAFGGFKFSGVLTLADGRPVTGFVSGAPFGGPDFGVTRGVVSSFGGFTGGRIPHRGRNSFTGPGLAVFDFRVAREISFLERYRIRLLWEAFNLFNRVNFTSVETTAVNFTARSTTSSSSLCFSGPPRNHANDCLTPRSEFLSPTASGNRLIGARQMQVSLRFSW